MSSKWENLALGDIVSFVSGMVDPRSPEYRDVPYVGPHNITPVTGKLVNVISASEAGRKSKMYKFTDEHILYSKIGPMLNKVATPQFSGISGSEVYPILPDKSVITKDFLAHSLRTKRFLDYVKKHSKRSIIPKMNRKALASYILQVPPLEEQQRIVSILDEAFNNISNSISQLEIKVQNSKELFLSTVENFFKKQGKTWEEPTLLELLERGWITSHLDGNHGGNYPRKSEFIDEGIRYISANCIRNETVDFTNSKFLSPERAARLRKGIAQDGDVLFAHNATVGPVAILRTNESKIILGTSLTYYRCNPEYIIPEYLAHYMRSYRFTEQYSQIMRQSTRNQVPITKQREFTHLIPPIELQSTMARKFDALQKETMELEKMYLQELTSYGELKQSILQEAFHGKLTGGIAA